MCSRRRPAFAALLFAMPLAIAGVGMVRPAAAATQIRPRVMVMIDTSGSMSAHFQDNATTGGDGSTYFHDSTLTRQFPADANFSLYVGQEVGALNQCVAPPLTLSAYDGVNSRIYAAKQAMTNVLNGSGDIDWGLMRYSGSLCPIQSSTFVPDARNANKVCNKGSQCTTNTCTAGLCVCGTNADCAWGTCNAATGKCACSGGGTCPGIEVCSANVCGQFPNFTPHFCAGNGNCFSGNCNAIKQCGCTNDGQCGAYEFCVGGVCGSDNNLCSTDTSLADYGATDTRNGATCGYNNDELPVSWAGTCGTTLGSDLGNCPTPQLCAAAGDCAAGSSCVALAGSAATVCSCSSAIPCPANYDCTSKTVALGHCEYTKSCVSVGGDIVVDPATQPSSAIFQYVDGKEDDSDAGGGAPVDPELRAYGHTPLAGAARTATVWYKNTVDTQKQCRPYVLVQITDGFDTCDTDAKLGPPAAAAGFVGATVAGAKNLNKVYVIGLAFGSNPSPDLDSIALAGGTQKARLANSQSDIEAALADIIASSVLTELCNNADDDCNNVCDDPFPDVAVNNAACTNNGQLAKSCTTGGVGHCNAPGVFACSADQRSEVCSARGCTNAVGATASGKAGTTINITGVSGFSAADVGNIFTVVAAANPGNVGNFTIVTVNSASSITITNPNGVNEAGTIHWSIYCANTETCNGFDDNCNGVIDDCAVDVSGNPIAGSCCTQACPACARPDHIELCNGCDDDCDGVIDDNLVDTGFACGSNVGDCAPGTTVCCAADPNGVGFPACVGNSAVDKLYCKTGNPGYPKPADLCDGTDDNCDGTANNVGPHACFTDGAGNPLTGTPGQGVCKSGTQTCTTVSLAQGSPGCPPEPPWPTAGVKNFCPNPTPTYSACSGAVGATPELCNGLDDDCNSKVDDSPTDPWVGTPCCTTGNNADCTNIGGSTQCQFGSFQCVSGGKSCAGGDAKSPEVCDGVDNDCNGIIDDVPGLGAACGNNVGACRGVYVCIPALAGSATGPNGLTCDQLVSPSPEVCNGKDDDCNNIVDDPGEVAVNDPRLGTACDAPVAPHDQLPCMAGAFQCSTAGQGLICVGAVQPVPNKCNGISTDCTGTTLSVCPNGGTCFQGNCLVPCAPGEEFPCPGGFVCVSSSNLCVPNGCARLSCPSSDICQIDSNGRASCVDPCSEISCTAGLRCLAGRCVDDSCLAFGCPAGQVCSGSPAACIADPCTGVQCASSQFCDPVDGKCESVCPASCGQGKTCIDGVCASDPCSGVNCFEGQTCAVQGGVGSCITNQCGSVSCRNGEACCGGACAANPCSGLTCPLGGTCDLDPLCQPRCHAAATPPHDLVVGAGGGGFACSVGRRADTGNDAGAALVVLAMLGGWLLRRRKSSSMSSGWL